MISHKCQFYCNPDTIISLNKSSTVYSNIYSEILYLLLKYPNRNFSFYNKYTHLNIMWQSLLLEPVIAAFIRQREFLLSCVWSTQFQLRFCTAIHWGLFADK